MNKEPTQQRFSIKKKLAKKIKIQQFKITINLYTCASPVIINHNFKIQSRIHF